MEYCQSIYQRVIQLMKHPELPDLLDYIMFEHFLIVCKSGTSGFPLFHCLLFPVDPEVPDLLYLITLLTFSTPFGFRCWFLQ